MRPKAMILVSAILPEFGTTVRLYMEILAG